MCSDPLCARENHSPFKHKPAQTFLPEFDVTGFSFFLSFFLFTQLNRSQTYYNSFTPCNNISGLYNLYISRRHLQKVTQSVNNSVFDLCSLTLFDALCASLPVCLAAPGSSCSGMTVAKDFIVIHLLFPSLTLHTIHLCLVTYWVNVGRAGRSFFWDARLTWTDVLFSVQFIAAFSYWLKRMSIYCVALVASDWYQTDLPAMQELPWFGTTSSCVYWILLCLLCKLFCKRSYRFCSCNSWGGCLGC